MSQALDDQPSVNVLWFKRDLRLRDHAPLQAALADRQNGRPRPLLLLYCFEPSLIADPNYELRHWRFVQESLLNLNQQLAAIPLSPAPVVQAQPLVHEWLPFEFDDEPLAAEPALPAGPAVIWVFYREVMDVLQALQTQVRIHSLFSHQETGLRLTYQRDKQVAQFCRQQGIPWQEFQAGGVIRGLKNRATWSADWLQTMLAPQAQPALTSWHPAALPPPGLPPTEEPTCPRSGKFPIRPFNRGANITPTATCRAFSPNASPTTPSPSPSLWRVGAVVVGCRPIWPGAV